MASGRAGAHGGAMGSEQDHVVAVDDFLAVRVAERLGNPVGAEAPDPGDLVAGVVHGPRGHAVALQVADLDGLAAAKRASNRGHPRGQERPPLGAEGGCRAGIDHDVLLMVRVLQRAV